MVARVFSFLLFCYSILLSVFGRRLLRVNQEWRDVRNEKLESAMVSPNRMFRG